MRNIEKEGYIKMKKEKITITIAFAMIAIFYTIRYLYYWNYLTDDAGITFGASKTFVEYGRLSIDRYAETVEAYSNPSLTAILAFIYWLGIDLPIGSKILNWIIGLIILFLVYEINNFYGEKVQSQTSWMNLLSPLLLSLMTDFFLWGAGGLENMIYGLATAGLIFGALKYEKSRDTILLTCFSGLISITRPEGIIFVIFIYFGIVIQNYIKQKSCKNIAFSFSLFSIFYFLFIAFRYHIFSWVLPNTYYAKIDSSYIVSFWNGGDYLFNFVISYFSLLILIIVFLYSQVYFTGKNILGNNLNKSIQVFQRTYEHAFNNNIIYFSIFLIFANVIYILRSGTTWGVARYLTPILISLSVISTEMFKNVNNLIINYENNYLRAFKFLNITIFIILVLFFLQMISFNYVDPDEPTFWDVKAKHADFGNEVGSYLITNHYVSNPKQITYMVPDLGATSYYAKNYTILDSAGLGNVPIAHNHYDPKFFRHYVFDIKNPALIETHLSWSRATNILSYDQFNKNYALIKGPGIVKYNGINTPNGYYIRKDIFASPDLDYINNYTNMLCLKHFDIGSTIFSQQGEIELNTYWEKNPEAIPKIIDNHKIEVYLRNSFGEYLIDSHKLTGGYYLPNQWDTNLVILDKKVIYPKNIPDGNYSLMIKVIYPNNKVESHFLEEISLDSKTAAIVNTHVDNFKMYLGKQNYSAAKNELRIIKGISVPLYETCYYDYLESKLDFIDTLIDKNNLKEADGLLKPIDGLQTADNQINNRLRDTEFKLANLYEKMGNLFEAEGNLPSAIDFYEYSICYNSDNSKLRAHIEAIRR